MDLHPSPSSTPGLAGPDGENSTARHRRTLDSARPKPSESFVSLLAFCLLLSLVTMASEAMSKKPDLSLDHRPARGRATVMGKARTSRREDLVVTRTDSTPFGTPPSTASVPPCPHDAARSPAPRHGDDPLLGDLWRKAAVALAGWLLLLWLTLLALSTVARQPPPVSPVAPGPSELIAPGFRGSSPRQPSSERKTTP